MRIGLQIPNYTWPNGGVNLGDSFGQIAERAVAPVPVHEELEREPRRQQRRERPHHRDGHPAVAPKRAHHPTTITLRS